MGTHINLLAIARTTPATIEMRVCMGYANQKKMGKYMSFFVGNFHYDFTLYFTHYLCVWLCFHLYPIFYDRDRIV